MNIFNHRKTKFTIATPGRLYIIYITVIVNITQLHNSNFTKIFKNIQLCS